MEEGGFDGGASFEVVRVVEVAMSSLVKSDCVMDSVGVFAEGVTVSALWQREQATEGGLCGHEGTLWQ